MATADPTRKGTLDWACLSGTLSGNPIACAAGVAALTELKRPGVYDRLAALGRMLREGLARVAAGRGVPLQALGEGPIAQPIFIDPATRVTADHDLRGADGKKATRLGHELIRRGVFVIPGAKMYISLAHTDADIARDARGLRRGADGALTAPAPRARGFRSPSLARQVSDRGRSWRFFPAAPAPKRPPCERIRWHDGLHQEGHRACVCPSRLCEE